MARLPYPDTDAPHIRDAAAAARRARGGAVINLYRMLLHSPPLATAWLGLGSHLRYAGLLDDRTRELITCLVGVRTRSAYELHHHAHLARAAGVTQEQLDALERWSASSVFDERDRHLLGYADAVLDDRVDDDLLAAVRRHLPEPQVIELTALTAYYLAVSRFVNVLALEPEER